MFLIGKPEKSRQGQSGFTLIEISIVVLIIGVMMIPLVQLYSTYTQQKKITVTKVNMDKSSSEISRFYSYMGSYPAPASLTASPNSSTYARSISAADIALLLPGTCTSDGGVCMVAGQRDANGDMVNDPVLVGAVPMQTIRGVTRSSFSGNADLDGWNNKLTYAVTASLVNTGTFNNEHGVIGAIDEHYQNTAGIVNDAHFALISHGPNGSGAYSSQGGQRANCGSIVPDGFGGWITTAVENHNCNSDGLFMQGLQTHRGGTGLFNDDRVVFGKAQDLSLWEYTPDFLAIFNKNIGNVGVKTTSPTEKLHVAGTIKARTTVSTGANTDTGVLAAEICQSDGSGCFNITTITGSVGAQCPIGQVMRRIGNIQTGFSANCAVPSFQQLTPTDCSGGWVHGIRTNGDVICYP